MIKRTLSDYLSDANNQWRQIPLDLLVRNLPGHRSAAALNGCMDQFNVSGSARYKPKRAGGGGVTWCNVYLGDATSALGADVPHWIDERGRAAYASSAHRETTANEIYDRLLAGVDGYAECTPDVALAKALLGHPVVVAWRNPSGPGHVALVEPVSDARGILVAQAGAVCGRRIPLRAAFGDRAVRMFWHE